MEETKFCKHCGEKIDKECIICPKCGKQVEELKTSDKNIIINNSASSSASAAAAAGINSRSVPLGTPKSKSVALCLCIFLGGFGAHKFYEGKTMMGILYLCTMGLCGIGWIIDIFALLGKPSTYYV